MSKVVKGIGRAIGNVVKGAVNVVKKVVSSKFGKIALGAALMYFGIPAAQGLFGAGAAGAAGTSGLAGAMTNISTAWSGLTGAASNALAGNLSQAGSQLAGGFTGTGVTSAATPGAASTLSGVAGAATHDVGTSLTGLGPQTPATYALTNGPVAIPGANGMVGSGVKLGASAGGLGGLGGQLTTVGGGGLINQAMSSPLAGYALQLAGGVYTDYSKAKMLDATQQRQDRLDAEARARYNTNNGTALWGPAPRG